MHEILFGGLFTEDDDMDFTGMHSSDSYLLQFVCDHGESSEDAVCGAGDGDDPLWTRAL